MKKSDLKSGMILEMRDGERYLFCNNVLRGLKTWTELSHYNDDLIDVDGTKYLDIVKIYKDTKEGTLIDIFEEEKLELIWERKKQPKLSKEDIELLKSIKLVLPNMLWLARDKSTLLYVYDKKPNKYTKSWGMDIANILVTGRLTFIKWEDEEPYNIDELLKENE